MSVDLRDTPSGLEQNPHVVLAVAGARVYHTKLNVKDPQWTYSTWRGTLEFGRDVDTAQSLAQDISDAEKHWFRLVDIESQRTVWIFKFPENFEYVIDRPFFHVFLGRTRRYGFLFNDDDEANVFGRKVVSQLQRGQPPKKARRGNKNTSATRSNSLTVSIKRAMISAPAVHSFRHVAHVGINKDGIFEASKGLDDTWKSTLADIQGHGISVCDTDVLRQSNFGDGFWRGVEAIRAVDSSDAERYGDIPRKMASASAM